MISKYIFLIAALVLISGCSFLETKPEDKNLLITKIPAQSEQVEPRLNHESALFKKTISDQDFKKKQDDKELKKRVVVLPFIDLKGFQSLEELKKSYDSFVDALNQSEEMIALDSSVLKFDYNLYKKNHAYDLKAIAKDSQKAGISSILEGRIVDIRFKNEKNNHVIGINNKDLNSQSIPLNKSLNSQSSVAFEVVVQVRMMNIRSEQELFNTVKTVLIEDEAVKISNHMNSKNFFNQQTELTTLLVKDAFLDFVPKLVESLKYIVWEGRIAALRGEKIYLNVGQISGVQVGDILKVVDDGTEVYDTELGYHIGKVSGRAKGTLEVIGFFGQDGAISVIHSGAGFKENDRIELYQ